MQAFQKQAEAQPWPADSEDEADDEPERKQTAPADAESLTAVEYRDRLYDLADRFAVLDIPMLIDRSADEADALAQADWLRLYGILFGNETTAERMIREITSREG